MKIFFIDVLAFLLLFPYILFLILYQDISDTLGFLKNCSMELFSLRFYDECLIDLQYILRKTFKVKENARISNRRYY